MKRTSSLLAGDFTLGGVGPGETYPREELLPDAGACAIGSLSCLDPANGWTLPGPMGDGVGALGGGRGGGRGVAFVQVA